jgi:hypothetical protein
MALFGLSPLFLSLVASNFFTVPDTGLDITRFLNFLSILVGSVHLIGAFNLRTPSSYPPSIPTQIEDPEQSSEVDEYSQLLPRKPPVTPPINENGSTLDLFRDPHFWLLVSILVVTIGSVSGVVVSHSVHES